MDLDSDSPPTKDGILSLEISLDNSCKGFLSFKSGTLSKKLLDEIIETPVMDPEESKEEKSSKELLMEAKK